MLIMRQPTLGDNVMPNGGPRAFRDQSWARRGTIPSSGVPLPGSRCLVNQLFEPGLSRPTVLALALVAAVLGVAQQPPAGAALCYHSVAPFSMNSSGVIAGSGTLPGEAIPRGFVRSKDGSITTFLVEDFVTRAKDINSAGTIAGSYFDGGISHGYVRAANG